MNLIETTVRDETQIEEKVTACSTHTTVALEYSESNEQSIMRAPSTVPPATPYMDMSDIRYDLKILIQDIPSVGAKRWSIKLQGTEGETQWNAVPYLDFNGLFFYKL